MAKGTLNNQLNLSNFPEEIDTNQESTKGLFFKYLISY